MTKISVIIPVYNVEKYLRKCLDSIINQTFKDIEIIAINDCSTDNSLSILREYEAKGIKLINLPKNAGVSTARNIGIDTATGKYIAFIDSDDWIDKIFFEKLYLAAEKHEADIAVCGIKHCHSMNINSSYLKLKKEIVTTDIKEKLSICNVPKQSYVWNKLYRLDKLKKYNLRFVEEMVYEDIIFIAKALYYMEKLVTVPGINYNYLIRKNSIVATKSAKNEADNKKARMMAEEFYKEHNIDIDYSDDIVKKIKFCGLTVFKTIKGHGLIKFYLFSVIRWQKPASN